MDNIIQFPAKNKNSLEHSIEHIEEVRRNYCDEVTSDIMEAALSVLSSYGLTVHADEQSVKSVIFVEEAIRALVYTTKNLDHQFQSLADIAVTLEVDAKKELKRIIEESQLHT